MNDNKRSKGECRGKDFHIGEPMCNRLQGEGTAQMLIK